MTDSPVRRPLSPLMSPPVDPTLNSFPIHVCCRFPWFLHFCLYLYALRCALCVIVMQLKYTVQPVMLCLDQTASPALSPGVTISARPQHWRTSTFGATVHRLLHNSDTILPNAVLATSTEQVHLRTVVTYIAAYRALSR